MDEYWKSDLLALAFALSRRSAAQGAGADASGLWAGLIGARDRKSIQPMAARDVGVGYDQLPHFIASGVWDGAPLEKVLLTEANRMVDGAEAWMIIDDTALPKKGERSGAG